MHILDWILERDNVARHRAVDVVEQRSQRGALTGAGRARDDDQSARLLGLLYDDGRQAQLLSGRDLHRQQTERQRRVVLLVEQVAAHTHRACKCHRKIGFTGAFQLVQLVLIRELLCRILQILLGIAAELTVNTQHRRDANGQMHIRGVFLQRILYQSL